MVGDEIVFDGVKLCETFGMILRHYVETPPAPKEINVSVKGGDDIDLTDALGEVAYSNRKQTFEFLCMSSGHEFIEQLTKLKSLLHGRRAEYQLSWEEGYTFEGRFRVSAYRYDNRHHGYVTLIANSSPWKVKEKVSLSLSAVGGKVYRFQSGRRIQQPTVTCEQTTTFVSEGKKTIVGAGKWRLNDVMLHEGWNEVYINTYPVQSTLWSDIGEGGDYELTWASAASMRWDEVQRLATEGDVIDKSWSDLASVKWSELATQTWAQQRYKPDASPSKVIFEYEWEDL